ncbi:MAG: peptidyl-prolyl cis-trans isomerase [Acidimicrobiales bacterium]
MRRVLILFLAVAVGIGLATYYVPHDAASVGSASVTRRSLATDLGAIAGSGDYQCFLSEQDSLNAGRPVTVPILGEGSAAGSDGVYATTFADGWLGQMVQAEVTGQLVARHGLAVTPGGLAIGRAVLERRITDVLDTYARGTGSAPSCGGTGAAVLGSMPAGFAAEQVRAQTDQSLLAASAAGGGLSDGALSAFFVAHRSEFDRVCLSLIEVTSQATAQHLRQVIAGGTPFAQVARTSSVDSTTASAGGVAGCGVVAGTTLLAPVEHLAIGQVSAPVAYNSAFLLVQVTSRTPATLSSVHQVVQTVMLLAGQSQVTREIKAALQAAHVSIDPRFGQVKAGTSTILPPTNPPAGILLAPPSGPAGAG